MTFTDRKVFEMSSQNKLALFLVILVLSILPLSGVIAAPNNQELTPNPVNSDMSINGVIESIEIRGDPTLGTATVFVTLSGEGDGSQTIEISLDTAISYGLVSLNLDGSYSINETKYGTSFSIDTSLVIISIDNKVATAIADFLATLFNTDSLTIMAYHQDGMGFGVIAQAGFMAYALGGDGSTLDAILIAKQTGDYSALVLPDGMTANNWGELRKAALTSEKSMKNLGAIMSGRADNAIKTNNKSTNGHNNSNKDNPHKK